MVFHELSNSFYGHFWLHGSEGKYKKSTLFFKVMKYIETNWFLIIFVINLWWKDISWKMHEISSLGIAGVILNSCCLSILFNEVKLFLFHEWKFHHSILIGQYVYDVKNAYATPFLLANYMSVMSRMHI